MAGERIQRKLAAILAADVVGYSRLVEADKEGTLNRLKTLRRELFAPTTAEFGGRFLLMITLTACASISATEGIAPTDLSPVRVGADREMVEAVLGASVMTESSRGLTIDTYEYDRGRPPQDFDESGFAAEVLFLPWQPLIAAAVAESREAQKGTLTITYDTYNRVVKIDPVLDEERRKLNERIQQAFCGGATTQYMAGHEQQHAIGVPPNKVRAYFWYSLSASNGRTEAKWQKENLKETMTPDEKAKAEERLRTWKAPDCESELLPSVDR